VTRLTHPVIVMPTYNEARGLTSVVQRVRSAVPDADVLIVDDNSPDGTGAIADELAAADPQVKVMHRQGKDGLGVAYLAGFAWALQQGYPIIVQMDADGSHQPHEIANLIAGLSDADMVIGSRWIGGGGTQNWSRGREYLSRGGNAYTKAMLNMPVNDATGGFRAFRAEALQSLDLEQVASQGYCFQVDIARRAIHRGLRVREVPITFVERETGESKMSRQIVLEALWRVTAWGIGDRFRRSTNH